LDIASNVGAALAAVVCGLGTAEFRTGVLTGAGEAALAAGAVVARAGVLGAGAFDAAVGFLAMIILLEVKTTF